MASETFEPRRAKPGQVFTITSGSDGTQRELEADADGVVRPTTAADVAALNKFKLPVARRAARAEAAADADTDTEVVAGNKVTAKGGKD